MYLKKSTTAFEKAMHPRAIPYFPHSVLNSRNMPPSVPHDNHDRCGHREISLMTSCFLFTLTLQQQPINKGNF